MSIVDEDHTTAEQLPPVAVPVTEPDGPTFASLGLRPEVLQALTEIGFERPTDVQVQAIPLALARRDLLVQSRTGSGKTAAFGLPMCTGLLDDAREEVQALVLAPTRELALQVANECSRFCTHIPLRTVAIYGGAPMGPQVQALKGNAQIVAGTPGRVLDHIRRGTLDPSGIRVLVLDEADEMLSMGFQEEITAILQQLPAERQTMLFSATIPDEIERMIERYLHTPERIYLSEDFVGVREIRHIYYLVTGGDRTRSLLDILSYEKPELALIFCNTREDTGRVADFLSRNGFEAQAISSDLTQKDRERVMERMRQGELHCLVATDIAARGIDIADVTHVFNYTFPESADIYVHRTGRTGRAGRSGTAISLVSPREIGSFYYLKLIHRIFPEERHLPTVEELAARQEGELCQTLAARYEGQAASPAMRSLARRVWSMVDGEALVGRALWELLSGGTATARRRPAPPPPTRAASQPQRADAAPVETEGEGETASRLPSDDRGERSTRPERGGRRGGSDGRRGRGNGRDRGRGGRESGRESGRDGRRGERNGQRPPAEARTDERPDDVGAPRVAPEEEAGLRAAAEEREVGTDAGRKTRRSRSRSGADDRDAIVTSEGDVEYYETLDGPTREGQGSARGETEPPEVEDANVVRLFLNLGRRQGVRADELSRFIVSEGQLEAAEIVRVDVRDRYTFVNVVPDAADRVLERVSGKTLNDRTLRVERAKS